MCLMRVAAGPDERGEAGVVVMRAQAQRPGTGPSQTQDWSRSHSAFPALGAGRPAGIKTGRLSGP
jgi:hypothetical protein